MSFAAASGGGSGPWPPGERQMNHVVGKNCEVKCNEVCDDDRGMFVCINRVRIYNWWF